MTTAKTKLLTADDLLRLDSEGVRGELIRGVLHETMPVGKIHSKVVAKLVYLLIAFVLPRRLGTVMASELGVWLERDPDTVRAPDVAYISAVRMPLDDDDPGYSDVVPDMVVEVASPSDSQREISEKARMWLGHRVRLVWAVHPNTRTIDVYRTDSALTTLSEGDTLDGGEVLPGFTCNVSDIFGI